MDVKELEARFKEIDERAESGPVEVELGGDAQSSNNLSVSVGVRRKVTARARREGGPEAAASPATRAERLLDVNLDAVDVPDEYIERKVRSIFSRERAGGGLPTLKLEQIGASANFRVLDDCTYDAGPYRITAAQGFEYNRSSVPRVFWVIISKDDLSSIAPLFHDLLYHYGGRLPRPQVEPYRTFERKDADDLFLELMRKSGVKEWRAVAAYQAVRKFARLAWQG